MDVCESLRELIYEYSKESLNIQIWNEYSKFFIFGDDTLWVQTLGSVAVFAWSAQVPKPGTTNNYNNCPPIGSIYHFDGHYLRETHFTLPTRYFTSLIQTDL